MKKIKLLQTLILALLIAAGTYGLIKLDEGRITAKLDPVAVAQAATSNPSPASTGYWTNVLSIPGSYTSTSSMTNIARFTAPWPATLVGFQAIARTSGSGTMTVNFKEAGSSVLSTPVAINTVTVAEGVISDAAIADEALMSIDLAITSGGTWTNPTIQIIWKRK